MKEALVIDIGNTSIKFGRFSSGSLVEDGRFDNSSKVVEYVHKNSIRSMLVASVSVAPSELLRNIEVENLHVLTHETVLPIRNCYGTPRSLGVDRIAAVVGANALYPEQSNLVIDMGTCITYDYIDDQGDYWGGGISPGVDMRFSAMNHFTSGLPKVAFKKEAPLIGDSTEACLISGVINGIAAEIDGIINRYKQQKGNINVIMCGGDANSFESKIKAHIFASPKLVVIGLNRILEYNENN